MSQGDGWLQFEMDDIEFSKEVPEKTGKENDEKVIKQKDELSEEDEAVQDEFSLVTSSPIIVPRFNCFGDQSPVEGNNLQVQPTHQGRPPGLRKSTSSVKGKI